MKIQAEFEVIFDAEMADKCLSSDDGPDYEVCKYHKLRDRTHGRKAPTEYQIPKCTLFDEWLPGCYHRCNKCIEACNKAKEKELPKQ